MKPLLLFVFTLLTSFSFAQQLPSVEILHDSINASFRGLSVPSDNVVWVSGSNGTIGRSTDAGRTWKWMIVPGYEKRDFRDIEALDSLTAIIMAVDNPAGILKTSDGGNNWKVVFHKEQEGMFLDAMDIKDTSLFCIGDPVISKDGVKRFYFLYGSGSGDEWQELTGPSSLHNEAIFAASGSNLIAFDNNSVAFITGGDTSRLIFVQKNNNKVVSYPIPILHGRSTAGAFSACGAENGNLYITGGDYKEFWKDSGNVVYTTDSGKTWQRSMAYGYRSCIIQADKATFITCGTNGVDISFNGCKTWQWIYKGKGKPEGFNVCAKSKTGKAVFFAGSGRIGKLLW